MKTGTRGGCSWVTPLSTHIMLQYGRYVDTFLENSADIFIPPVYLGLGPVPAELQEDAEGAGVAAGVQC